MSALPRKRTLDRGRRMSANGHKQTHAVQLKLIHTVSCTFVSQLHRLGQFPPVRQSITDKPPGGPFGDRTKRKAANSTAIKVCSGEESMIQKRRFFYRLATASRAKVCRGHSVGRDSPERSRASQAHSEVERSNHCIHSSQKDWGSTALVDIRQWLGHFEPWQT
jgi:hypothetical protein